MGVRGSEKCGIELIPGEKKREKEATGKIIGIKNKSVILIADELPELPPLLSRKRIFRQDGRFEAERRTPARQRTDLRERL
jgi:hypothetical protein